MPGMQIRVLGVPQTGAKSRVETQIKLCIQLVTDDGDKAQWWSHLKLPEHMVAKDKLKRQVLLSTAPNGSKIANVAGLDNATHIKPEKMLFLSARVICASDPSRKVVTCLGCIQRERKRSQRRKENKVKHEQEERQVDEKSIALEEQKVLLFNCSEVVDFNSGDTILPTRITCYCRHHNERLGFCIYFEMLDHTGKQVATGMSPPIMITDDHKSNKVKAGRKRQRTEIDKLPPNASILSSPFDQPPFAPSSSSSSSSAVPNTIASFQQNRPMYNNPHFIPQPYQIQPRPTHSTTTTTTTTTTAAAAAVIMDPRSPLTPLDSPMGGNSPFIEKAMSPVPAPNTERPSLQRLIPNEGPTFGGVEVTLLGSGFRAGLTCMFGDVAASSTHFWSPNTLVCILPPAAEAGTVVVSFKEYPLVVDSQDVTLFTYYNENDRALMELALQVVGLKMTGKVEDARDIAMRIVQGGGNNNNGNGSNTTSSAPADTTTQKMCLERHIIQVLQVMCAFRDVESSDVSLTSAQGHSMLHLAAMLGFAQLTDMLIDLGCDVNITDKNGYTALHYAAWHNHASVVRVLLEKGAADPDISNRWNKKPVHLTDSSAIQSALWNHVVVVDESDAVYDDYDSSDKMSADVDTSFDEEESDEESVWLSDHESVAEDTWRSSYLSDSEESIEYQPYLAFEGLRHRRRQQQQQQQQSNTPPAIQYLHEEESLSHSTDEIMDAETLYHVHHLTDYEMDEADPKEMNWMQRTLSHFQQPTDNRSFLQNIKNTIPAKPAELNLKTIADHVLEFSRPSNMIANMSVLFGADDATQQNKSSQDEPAAEQALAWYMALAYAMGARSLTEEEERKEQHPYELQNSSSSSGSSSSSHSQQIYTAAKKRRDKRLFSFWVPMLCLMVIWLIFQLVSSHPSIADTIISISGFRRQYLTMYN
ncbi:uncharacterized protein B0P05DRAFT_636680 [Gilbertella persicaria]|uniref:uncharacterized protein n=1 Tax=Gilbertella persicaria TaxID=101096 RepID=UPI0022204854|nr:uncharacterized protein B0P05DRAFT_636680 [Gilbertella persicaria]KAI8082659.1 hypothetical protein B0P05DRAFT_636680 [Gilbertella persicaria]